MNSELENKLWNAGKEEKAYGKETWYEIIDSLLDDFHQFVGQCKDQWGEWENLG